MTVVLEGLGTSVPDREVTNHDLAAYLDTSDEWVRNRTGIVARRWVDDGTSTGDLAVAAGERALKSAGVREVDALVLATTTPDHIVPSTGPTVAARLGLPHIAAMDVNGACSGFVYGLAVATGLIEGQIADRVLLIGADTVTRVIDKEDRDTAVLFGDGAGAVVVRRGETGEPGTVGPFDIGSDGEASDILHVPAGGSRRPADAASVAERAHYLRMDGREVYRRAVVGMAASCRRVLHRAGAGVDGIDRLVGHQANIRILEGVAARLGIAPERCVVNIDRFGNTSAASIPLALADAGAQPGERLLLTAFGAGLTWGSALLGWPDLEPA